MRKFIYKSANWLLKNVSKGLINIAKDSPPFIFGVIELGFKNVNNLEGGFRGWKEFSD